MAARSVPRTQRCGALRVSACAYKSKEFILGLLYPTAGFGREPRAVHTEAADGIQCVR